MPYRHLEPLSKQLTIVIGLTVVGFMAFGLALSVYRNLLFEQTLQDISAKNDQLRENIEENHRKVDYYQSAQYKDKYGKEHLGRLNAGERLVLLPSAAAAGGIFEGEGEFEGEQQELFEQMLQQIPIIDHWKLFLFQKQKLEELRSN